MLCSRILLHLGTNAWEEADKCCSSVMGEGGEGLDSRFKISNLNCEECCEY
jgi:hypothetical protein